jgi:Tubulin binding cofactor C
MVVTTKKYIATDGTELPDHKSWRKYEFETQYTFKRKHGETLVKLPDTVGGQAFEMADLTDCEVQLLDHSEQVQCDDLHNCKVFIAACSEALFVRNCTNCTFVAACKQVHIHTTEELEIHAWYAADTEISACCRCSSCAAANTRLQGLQFWPVHQD